MNKAFSLLLFACLFACAVARAASPAEMEADLQKHPDHLTTRIMLGNVYLKQQQFDKVIALLNSYTDQLTSEGFRALGFSYSSKKDYANEVRVLGLLVNKEPEDFQGYMLLGSAYLKLASTLNDPEKNREYNTNAIQRFRQALKLNPKYKPGYDQLLNTLLTQKANNEARELLMEGIKKFGMRPELLRELCRLDANDGFLDSAVSNCREAIKVAPGYADNYVYLVQALFDQKEDQLAENDIVSAARKFPQNEFVQWAAGTLFFKKKNFPVAARYFDAAVKADAKSGRAQFGLAQSRFEAGDEAGSYQPFMKACAFDSGTIDTFLSAGGKLKQKGNTKLGEQFITGANTCKK
jgi:tetratricopeptide (TPR) repeat protein